MVLYLMFNRIYSSKSTPSALMTCLICHQNEADFVGSHILPHSILESMYNDGRKGRDKEQNFQLTGAGSTPFFGREVLPETIAETLGRPVTDADLESTNPYLADNIFCTPCEKKLSYIETLYKQKVATPLASGRVLTAEQLRIAHFFWLTTLYRCAVTGFANFHMAEPLLRELATITKAIIVNSDSVAQTEQNCLSVPVTHNLFIGYFPPSADSGRHQVRAHLDKRDPYLITINQYVLAFNYRRPDQVAELEKELGVRLAITADGTSVKVFSAPEREQLLQYFWQLAAHYLVQEFRDNFSSYYRQKHGHLPNPAIVHGYIQELALADMPETVKFSTERIEQLTQKHSS